MRLLFKAFAVFALSALTNSAWAADQSVDLKTPRESLIKIDIYNPGLPMALLLGPGQGCRPRADMYDALAAESKGQGFTLVRLYWAYCVATPEGSASEDLSAEREDFLTALSYVKKDLGFTDANIFIGGKSLGTFVSFEVFKSAGALRGLVMLTPVCTDSADQNNHKNMFTEYYPGLSADTRPILVIQGNADPLCDTVHLLEYLKDKPNNFISLVTKGDHSLGIKNPDGQYNAELGARNLQAISKWLFTWLR